MSNLRLLIAFLILVSLLIATWVVADIRLDQPASTNRIAYVDEDGVIRTVRWDGSGAVIISPDVEGFFTWPTWSPDSGRLVYSGVTGSGENIRMSLFASGSNGRDATEIFAGEDGVTGLLAQGVIHYPLWSPDGDKVAFIAATADGLTLFMDDLSADPSAQALLDNGPLWISWAPDSEHLLAHRADEHFLINSDEDLNVDPLGLTDVETRVPAWSPDGTSFVTGLRANRTQYHILGSGVSGGEAAAPRRLLTTSPIPAYLWSPDGNYISIAHSSRPLAYLGLSLDVYASLSVYSDTDADPLLIVREPMLAHFWSPNGRQIAYARLSEKSGVLRWVVLDIASGERKALVDFVPSVAQLTMFQFFDQYAYSHSLWSPDSDALVFAGNLNTDAVTASFKGLNSGASLGGNSLEHDGEHIMVVNTSGDTTTRVIADGFMATWSPN
ncbi:MAG: hypothetical protein BZY79_00365 [SAR202 cluster bacterium Casp-Chloro-G4]|nr:hypothetical protein [Chloroflexota bacterium]MDA1228411.1 hypothetical protein [Chloroflexota bacterium]PKB62123.1 MAG: hypothetical protein BZY79_00365 [SAR202 cluster bacterium Casp-Chloro-G4]